MGLEGEKARLRLLREFVDRTHQDINRIAKAPLTRKIGSVVGLIVLVTGSLIAWKALPEGEVIPSPLYLVYIAVIGVPLMVFTNTWETRLSATILGKSFTWFQALRIATMASAANVLPLPGGALVRVAALKNSGTTLGSAGAVTFSIALVWLGLSFAYAGAWLTAATAAPWLGLLFLVVGVGALAVAVAWLRKLAGSWRRPIETLLLKTLSVGAGLLRMAWGLLALGYAADMASLSVFAVSGVSGAAVSIVPAGMGINETVAAALATVVGIPAGVAFLGATMVRALGLAVQVPLALVCVVADRSLARPEVPRRPSMYLLFRATAILAAYLAKALPIRRRLTVFLVTSPEGSRGDEAMLDAVASEMQSTDSEQAILLTYLRRDHHPRLAKFHDLRVESLQSLAWTPWKFLLLLASTNTFRFVGADVVDGVYGAWKALLRLAVAEAFARAGAQAAIVGFSFSKSPHPDCVAMLRGMPDSLLLVVRDPASRVRLEAQLGRQVIQAADLAFLINGTTEGVAAKDMEWISTQKAAGRALIAFGMNALLHDPRSEHVISSIGRFVTRLSTEHRSFIFVPHDIRDHLSDLVLCQRVYEALPAEVQSRVLLITQGYAPWQMKGIAGLMDFVISARMHFAIAGLSQGVPAFGFRYQGKFEGLFELVGLADLPALMDASTLVENPDLAAEAVEEFAAHLDEAREQLRLRMPSVKAMSYKNIHFETSVHAAPIAVGAGA